MNQLKRSLQTGNRIPFRILLHSISERLIEKYFVTFSNFATAVSFLYILQTAFHGFRNAFL